MSAGAMERTAAAAQLLREHGVHDADVAALGHAADVAAVRTASAHFDAVAALAPALKRLGFRYVAFDLAPTDPTA